MPNVPYRYKVDWHLVTGNGSLIPICSLSNSSLLPSLSITTVLYCDCVYVLTCKFQLRCYFPACPACNHMIVLYLVPTYFLKNLHFEIHFDVDTFDLIAQIRPSVCRFKSQSYLSPSSGISIIWREDSWRRRHATPQLSVLPNDGDAARWR